MTPERHNQLVPMGTQVSSKGRFRFCEGYGPEWIHDADGCRVMDDQDRTYIDVTGGLGGLVLGHNRLQSRQPGLFPLPHVAEGELAEYLNQKIPHAESMRFLKTGTDATSAAIRLARISTGRDHVVDLGSYHGWADAFITPEHQGVPEMVRGLTERTRDLSCIGPETAAVILEPWPLTGLDVPFLWQVAHRCDEMGAVLIYDEVISGFRCGMTGVVGHGAPVPDLTCAGKAMGNGWPISVVYGRARIMHEWHKTHISGTHFADPACMLGAMEVLEQTNGSVMFQQDPPVLPAPFQVVGTRMWWCVKGPDLALTLLQKKLLDLGWLTNFSHFTYLDLQEHEANYARDLVTLATEISLLDESHMREALGDIPLNRTVFRRNA